MIRVGIIGCGKIADAHAEQIQRIVDCQIVGVSDQEKMMAKQLYERFKIKAYFNDANELLEGTSPDVVHITTPPKSHFYLGKLCLEAGCHVYIEKPFTLNLKETEELIKTAGEKNLKITVGHNYQFVHVARQMRRIIRDGYLGGPPIHMESYYGYHLGDVNYARALLGNKGHWVRQLPGGLLHNLISHGICRIAEYLDCDDPQVVALGFQSPVLKSQNENIKDELRVIIVGDRVTAYFTFSTQMCPLMQQLRIYGPNNGLTVDYLHHFLIRERGNQYRSYLNTIVPQYDFAKQYLHNAFSNIRYFLKNDFQRDSGMYFLIKLFYQSIIEKTNPPISYREIILTSMIMDRIFEQLEQ